MSERLPRGAEPVRSAAIAGPGPDSGPFPLSVGQRAIWHHEALGSGCAYNLPVAVDLPGHLNAEALEQALGDIIARHGVLRSAFESSVGGGGPGSGNDSIAGPWTWSRLARSRLADAVRSSYAPRYAAPSTQKTRSPSFHAERTRASASATAPASSGFSSPELGRLPFDDAAGAGSGAAPSTASTGFPHRGHAYVAPGRVPEGAAAPH